ncbi:lysine N(6)-hydroxylase/L-ornithine N(5)-oxygenase family protein [Saccharothrix saharensis]|uniref:lysine N(6)-hydroxylase/L-ornithine N(5)-oxygenase family protein n=1 Tax=Saccharothrix saharensis TaxID=571190 RepID=UPI00368FD780
MAHQDVDIVAIGAGPSNLALGVALEELAPSSVAQRTLVLEQHSDVRWQRNLLLPWAESQVSFLKDLVTLRNPRSRFTFLNFLHEQGRLDEFINLSTFTPYRTEISAYLQWVADTLEHVRISYDRRCTSVEPRRAADGSVEGWLVTTAGGDTVSARDLVVGTGRDPHVPEVFAGLPAERVVHSTGYLEGIAALPKDEPHRVVVVGGAQSAAEMFRSVHDDLPRSRPTIVMRSIGFGHYQTSKFINELYYPSFIDEFHQAAPEARARILREMRQTNYAGLAPGLLEELYRMRYLQRLAGQERSQVLTMVDVVGARLDGDDIVLDLRDSKTGTVEELRCDIVLLGTGFDPRPPRLLRALMEPLGITEPAVDRGYRVDLGAASSAALYLQGVNEETHGISDSLLSVLAQRSEHIVDDILDRRRPRSNGSSTRLVTTGGSA